MRSVAEAKARGFSTGVVSNAYWATSEDDDAAWLTPMVGTLDNLTISSDLYHANETLSRQAKNAQAAAEHFGITSGYITVAQPKARAASSVGTLPPGESAVMYRGRAAAELASQAPEQPWQGFTRCPHEDLREPARVHVDPLGNVHICQGISLGNLFERPLVEICRQYEPDSHPIVGPLLAGGPAGLMAEYGLTPGAGYADACHLCDHARRALRRRFPEYLTPDQMYGVP